MRIPAGRIDLQCMPEVGSGFFGGAEFEVIHADNDVETGEVWTLAEGVGQIAGCGVKVEEALVSEAQVHLGLDQGWIQGENLFEFFDSAMKIALPEGGLAGAKRCFDLLL